MDHRTVSSDVLIIGAGIAGLRAAYEASVAGCSVRVVSRGPRCSAVIAGFNAPVGPGDSVELFEADINRSGDTVNDPVLAKVLAAGASDEVRFLEREGFSFAKREDGSFDLLKPLHCSVPRLVNCGTATGAEEERLLLEKLEERGVAVDAPVSIIKLLTSDGAVCGALGVRGPVSADGDDAFTVYSAKAVIMAAGGCGGLFEVSTYPGAIRGDSAALAYDAGAEITNMEFIDREPLSLLVPDALKGAPLSSTMLFAGAKLTNADGEDIISKFFGDAAEMSKGALSRAIFEEIGAGRGTEHGGVWFDCRALSREELLEHENYLPVLEKNGIDLSRERVEVAPSVHTCLGGVRIDEKCRSTVPGLFAAGEAAGNIHGAGRIGGNAGTEVLVFGAIAGRSAAEYAKDSALMDAAAEECAIEAVDALCSRIKSGAAPAHEYKKEIRRIVSEGFPMVCGEACLERMERAVHKEREKLACVSDSPFDIAGFAEALNMLTTAEIIASSALARKESRGVFFRSDHPGRRLDLENINTVVFLESGCMKTIRRRHHSCSLTTEDKELIYQLENGGW